MSRTFIGRMNQVGHPSLNHGDTAMLKQFPPPRRQLLQTLTIAGAFGVFLLDAPGCSEGDPPPQQGQASLVNSAPANMLMNDDEQAIHPFHFTASETELINLRRRIL